MNMMLTLYAWMNIEKRVDDHIAYSTENNMMNPKVLGMDNTEPSRLVHV